VKQLKSSGDLRQRSSPDDGVLVGELNSSICKGVKLAPRQTLTKGRPLWIPGYPGSGSGMLRDLIQGMTGLVADEVWTPTECLANNAVTCKTHWPLQPKMPPSQFVHVMDSRALLLFRHPLQALPSYLNWVWERRNKLKDHSVQAPKDAWVAWRDKNFEREILAWKRFFTIWRNKEPYEIVDYLAYEHLVDPVHGPRLAVRLARWFQEAHHQTAPLKDVPCLWFQSVKQKRAKKRSQHNHVPQFTTKQLQRMTRVLDELIAEIGTNDDLQLVTVLQDYRETVRKQLSSQ
jgi:hypothetical protein